MFSTLDQQHVGLDQPGAVKFNKCFSGHWHWRSMLRAEAELDANMLASSLSLAVLDSMLAMLTIRSSSPAQAKITKAKFNEMLFNSKFYHHHLIRSSRCRSGRPHH